MELQTDFYKMKLAHIGLKPPKNLYQGYFEYLFSK